MIKSLKYSLWVILVLILITACKPQEIEQPLDEVTLQLKWVHQAQFAGFYLAQERGYYAEENLKVTFIEGGPGIDPMEQVASGNAQFGVAAPEAVIMQPGPDGSIVAIATIFRRSPVVLASLAGSNIKRPADLLGRKVAVAGIFEFKSQLSAMFERLDLDMSQVEIVPHSYDLTPLIEGEVDVLGLYSAGGLIRLSQLGYEANLIWPSEYGVHMYADVLITTDELAQQNPEIVTRFLRATLHGWRDAIGDTDAAVTVIMNYARDADPDLQAEMMEASLPLICTGEAPIGWMDADAWVGMYDILLEQGILTAPLDLSQVYTMQFLQEVYGGE